MHGWYSFPEGYSPAFVDAVAAEYCVGARRVLRPILDLVNHNCHPHRSDAFL